MKKHTHSTQNPMMVGSRSKPCMSTDFDIDAQWYKSIIHRQKAVNLSLKAFNEEPSINRYFLKDQ